MNINWSLVWEADDFGAPLPFTAVFPEVSIWGERSPFCTGFTVISNWRAAGTATRLQICFQDLIFPNICPGGWVWWPMQSEQWVGQGAALMGPQSACCWALTSPKGNCLAHPLLVAPEEMGMVCKGNVPRAFSAWSKWLPPSFSSNGLFWVLNLELLGRAWISKGAECPLPKITSWEARNSKS